MTNPVARVAAHDSTLARPSRTGAWTHRHPKTLRRRVLFVVNEAPFFVSHRLPLAVAAAEVGYDVSVACPEGPKAEVIRDAGIRVFDIPLNRRGMKIGEEWRAFRSLVSLYREVSPDLVHHVTVKPVLYGSVAARLANVHSVVNAVPGLGYLFLARGTRAALRREVISVAYRCAFKHRRLRTIFQNPDDVSLFIGRKLIDPPRVTLIRGSGVDLDAFYPAPEPAGIPVVVLPARLLWDKGVGEFVAAARLLHSRGVAARFALVGDTDVNRTGVSTGQLMAWHDEGVVEWWGRREDMPHVLACSHVVCLPSYREGLPKALLEAAACGRAIVTTDVPGCREAVRDGVNGILVPPRDARTLADAIERLVNDSQLRARMGLASRSLAEREFGIERVIAATLDIYEELLQ